MVRACQVASVMSDSVTVAFQVRNHGSVHGSQRCPWGFSRQQYGRELPALLQGICPTQGLNPHLTSPALASGFFTTSDVKDLMDLGQTRRKGRTRKWQAELPDSQSSRCPSVPNSLQHTPGDSSHSRRVHSICHHTVLHTQSLSLQKTETAPHQSQPPRET